MVKNKADKAAIELANVIETRIQGQHTAISSRPHSPPHTAHMPLSLITAAMTFTHMHDRTSPGVSHWLQYGTCQQHHNSRTAAAEVPL